MVALVVPFFKDRQWQGYVCGSVDVAYCQRLLQASLPTPGITASVVDRNGRVLASTRKELSVGTPYDRRATDGADNYQWSPSARNLAAVQRWRASYRVQRVSLHSNAPWDLYVEAPYAASQRQLEQIYSFNLTTALTLIAGAFILASLLATALSFPLDELARVTTDLPSQLLYRKGHVREKWPKSRVREIDRLVRNFRSMEASLRMTIQDNLKARADLEAERTRLDEANRLKDDFLAVLSHELRTPLVPVLGYADLIARGVLKGEDALEAARSVERNARTQLRLIEDLLDVSAIMSGKMRLQMGVVNLQVATREAGETMRIRAHDTDVGLFFDLDETTPYLWGDAARLRQAVWKLISNSLKFTPSGGSITVKLSHHKNASGVAYASLVVADTGIGIEPDFLPYVFDRFRQAGDHMTRPAGGLGLGLAIAQYFVERHGGTIRADSPGEGMGATFTITLPLRPVPKDKMSDAEME
jgi:signal transduction histidine kinase